MRDHGGLALGLAIIRSQEFGIQVDHFKTLQKKDSWGQFLLARTSLATHPWQGEDRGLDAQAEGSLCYGFSYHVCWGLGLRQQNPAARYLQSTLELGSAFLLAIFVRPMLRIHHDPAQPSKWR